MSAIALQPDDRDGLLDDTIKCLEDLRSRQVPDVALCAQLVVAYLLRRDVQTAGRWARTGLHMGATDEIFAFAAALAAYRTDPRSAVGYCSAFKGEKTIPAFIKLAEDLASVKTARPRTPLV